MRAQVWRPAVDRAAGRMMAAAAGGVLLLGLTGCSGSDGDAALRAAEANVSSKQEALDQAQAAAETTSRALCDAGSSYITAIDRYGDVLVQTAPTVGDVVTAGADLEGPRDQVLAAAEEARAAQEQVDTAQKDLLEAQKALASLQGSEPPEPQESETAAALPQDAVDRVRQAESDFSAAREGIQEDTPLADAGQQFNSAVVALEMSWLQLFANSGCLSDTQQEQAQAAAVEYTTALQEALAEAGYFEGEVDGIYGPSTVAAVKALQESADLPQTGAMDKATRAALDAQLAAQGGADTKAAIASTAAIQQTLALTGYWDGPIDGQWTEELTDAVKDLQKDLGLEPTGEVDAATIEAFQEALAAATATPSPTASAEPSPSAPEPSEAPVSPAP